MDDDNFAIPYVFDNLPNSWSGHKIKSQSNQNLLVLKVYGEEPITKKGALDDLQWHQ